MSTVVMHNVMSVDGFIADPHDSLDWLFRQEQDQAGPLSYDEFFAGIGASLMLPVNGVNEPVINATTFGAVVIMVIITTLITPFGLKWSLGKSSAKGKDKGKG